MLVEGWTFLSKPKIIVNKNCLFEQELVRGITSILEDDSSGRKNEGLRLKDIKDGGSNLRQDEEQKLELELLGTAIGSTKDPIAFIKDLTSNKQGIYRLGNVIREAKVVKIRMGEVTLDLNGKTETLKLSKRAIAWAKIDKEGAAIVSVSADQRVVSRAGLLTESDNILKNIRNIKIKPYYEAEKVAGMMVEGVTEGSIITAAGIHNRDIIKTVNNQKIDSYQKALQVFSKLRNQSEIKVSLLRGGEAKTLSYRLEN
jgi:type II secretion system protein C